MLTSSANFATALRHRHFRNLWLGQIVANIGNYFYFLALLISVNELTGSTLAMSLMTISFALPQLVFGMAAGVYVDRWDRRRVMILSDVLRGALVLLCLFVHDPQQVWIYYVVGGFVCTGATGEATGLWESHPPLPFGSPPMFGPLMTVALVAYIALCIWA